MGGPLWALSRALPLILTLTQDKHPPHACIIGPWKQLPKSGDFAFRNLSLETVSTMAECIYRCEGQSSRCLAVHYSSGGYTGQCQLLGAATLPATHTQLWIPAGLSVMVRKSAALSVLAFRASKETGNEAYSLYSSSTVADSQFGMAHDLSAPLTQPFKHALLEAEPWPVQKITLQLWKDGDQVVHLAFDTSSSTKLEWFHYSALQTTNWTDLKTDGSSDIMAFVMKTNGKRSFWIGKYGGGCVDGGWLAVLDGNDVCQWSTYAVYPQFLYSDRDEGVVWGNPGTAEADDFVLLADVTP